MKPLTTATATQTDTRATLHGETAGQMAAGVIFGAAAPYLYLSLNVSYAPKRATSLSYIRKAVYCIECINQRSIDGAVLSDQHQVICV